MELQTSDYCPECNGFCTMEEIDGEFEEITPETFMQPAEYKQISLEERCIECGFTQTITDNYEPDPDSLSGGHDDY